jgi:hypothetical protein
MAGVGVDEVGPPTYANGAPTRSQREGAARLLAADENDDVFGFVDQGLDAIGRPIEWGLDRYIDAQQAESDARERVLRAAQDAAESLADRIEDEWTRGIESVDETINKLSGIAEFLESFGPTQRTPEQLENFREELERVGMVMSDDYVAFSNDPQIRWRLRNGIVALLTTHSSDDPALTRFWDGVTGRRDFLGDENPVRDVLPEPLEDPGVYLTEKIADPVTIAEIVAALLLPGPLKLKLAAFGLDLGFDVVDDLTD